MTDSSTRSRFQSPVFCFGRQEHLCQLRLSDSGCLEVAMKGPVLYYQYIRSILRRLMPRDVAGAIHRVILDFSAVDEIRTPWTAVVASLVKWANTVPYQCLVRGLHGQPLRVFELNHGNRDVARLLRGEPFGTPVRHTDPCINLLAPASRRKTRTPTCKECGYNLTGLQSPRCPECGWFVDWDRAYYDEDEDRVGTPAYRATRQWFRAGLQTTWLMLRHPVAFARRLRHDEPIWPAVLVALVSALAAIVLAGTMRPHRNQNVENLVILGGGIVMCIATASLYFMLLGSQNRWRDRLRLFVIVSLYSTCFVVAWPLVDGPPILYDPCGAGVFIGSSTIWPHVCNPFPPRGPLLQCGCMSRRRSVVQTNSQYVGRSLIFYWWAGILIVFAAVRTKPRWRAIGFIAVPYVAAIAPIGVRELLTLLNI